MVAFFSFVGDYCTKFEPSSREKKAARVDFFGGFSLIFKENLSYSGEFPGS